MNDHEKSTKQFAPALLAWFDSCGRHDLPWQITRTPYSVWVSEIMLQQTQVVVVVPYFERFMARFPTIKDLAAAPLDEVLHHWSGLGYYARARNLHRSAQIISSEHSGVFPRDLAAVMELPGVGRSTAGAILAQAWDERQPILDGNVKRVLARWFGVEGFPGIAQINAELWRCSDLVTPTGRAADFTQAIMDLGATLCTRTKPACGRCPVHLECVAQRQGLQAQLPTRRPRKKRPQRRVCWLVIRHGGAVLLHRRPLSGIWGGLWSFLEFENVDLAQAALVELQGESARSVVLVPRLEITHSFSHFDLIINPLVAHVSDWKLSGVMEPNDQTWYNLGQPAALGLAAPVAVLLDSLEVSDAGAG
jgi:A/G-specific adenine glycosylase